MELSTKAAMGICGLFIAGLCYVVDRTELPASYPGAPAMEVRPAAAEYAGLVARLPRLPDRGDGLERLVHRSSFELAADAQRAREEPLLLAELPPVVTTIASLPPPNWPEAGVEAAVVAQEEAEPAAVIASAATDEPAPASLSEAGQLAEGVGTPAVGGDEAVRRYRVRKGDTLLKIAREQWRSDDPQYVRRLVEANPQLRKRPNRILVGEELLIPLGPPVTQQTAAAEPPARTRPQTRELRPYTIRERDSLAAIARRFLNDANRWRELAELNNLKEPSRIVPGMQIRVPVLVAGAQG